MSDEEDSLLFYGTPLEPYDEDAFPKRKPVSLEDQIATDSHGRRRFHGAFTGGFSAGFFNTVGSLEGWTPSEFKSTRSEKASKLMQKPQDFMDDEDIGEHGIAPQSIKATKDYSTVKKRSRKFFTDGPIPGEPVLETLITSGNETVGYLLLRNMGIEDKIKKKEEVNQGIKTYGCEMPTKYQISEDMRQKEYQMPAIYKDYLINPKSNTVGLGYKGLEKPHVNLFHSTNLVVRDKNDKRFSIGGQAFGVGAFEDEDDDIYMKEDMTNYDFELTKEKDKPSSARESRGKKSELGMFEKSSVPLIPKKQYTPPTIPHWFTGIHKIRKSRFEPLEEVKQEPLRRNQMNSAVRAKYLGEEVNDSYTPSKQETDTNKQKKKTDENKNKDNHKNNKFDVSAILSDRFVSASQKEDVNNILENVEKTESLHGTQQMRDAAKMKMFGPLTRITSEWHPCPLLCKRFNVPEPFMDHSTDTNKKKTKNLIFQVQKHDERVSDPKPGISRSCDDSNLIHSEGTIKIEPDSETLTSSNPTLEVSLVDEISEDVKTEENSSADSNTKENPPVDFTEKIGIEDKIDLYKAVFLSSSESEDETEDQIEKQNEENKMEEFKVTILSEALVPQIKPLKEGILSGIDFRDFNKNRNKSQVDELEKEPTRILPSQDPLLYGPLVPATNGDTTRVQKIPENVVSSDSEDEWVEKGVVEKKKKSKHKKKEKKHKHKKHKKKDKR